MNKLLDILDLLRTEDSLSYEELLKSGSFSSERTLHLALRRLVDAGCVQEHLGVYFICDRGLKFIRMAGRKRLKHSKAVHPQVMKC